LPRRLLSKVWILTPNETETELLTGIAVKDKANAWLATQKLLARGAQNVIITMGASGAFVAGKDVNQGISQFIPAHKVKAVDTTAAGDVFNGALAVALAEGKSLLEAARFANAAAAISVGRPGAQDSAPRRQEIERLLGSARSQSGRFPQPQGGVSYPAQKGNALGKPYKKRAGGLKVRLIIL